LGVISVDPACQRQGIGSLLVRYGLEEAQKSGEKVFLISAPSGKPLYLSLGFRELEEIEVLGVTQAAMSWEPHKSG
jgi:ribosomal protein S18 acetylase RimI-like enzyme